MSRQVEERPGSYHNNNNSIVTLNNQTSQMFLSSTLFPKAIKLIAVRHFRKIACILRSRKAITSFIRSLEQGFSFLNFITASPVFFSYRYDWNDNMSAAFFMPSHTSGSTHVQSTQWILSLSVSRWGKWIHHGWIGYQLQICMFRSVLVHPTLELVHSANLLQ